MAEKKSKIVKRGTIAEIYKYSVSDDNVTTIKGTGHLGNHGLPLKLSAEHLVIAEGITSIGSLTFWQNYSLRTVHIPSTVTTIYSSAFARCGGLQAPILPDSILEIENCAFDECNGFREIVVPKNLKNISLGLFRYCCNLQKVDLANVERIGEDAFLGCRSLKQIVIPATVNYIAKGAFKDCESLETVVFQTNACTIEDPIFEGCQALKKVVLPASYAYRNLGILWGRDYTSLVNDIVEFLPYEGEFPIEAIEAFCKEYSDKSVGYIRELSQLGKSLKLDESTTILGFATLTKVYEYGNKFNARYTICFEEFHNEFDDEWFVFESLISFLKKHFLSKPVDRFDGLSNDYFRYIYKWNLRIPNTRYQEPDPEFVRASKLLGEEIMTPWYTLNAKHKIIRLDDPVPAEDFTDAVEGIKRLLDDVQGMIYTPVIDKMIDEFGPIKTCRALGYMIAAGCVIYHEDEARQEGRWSVYKEPKQAL